MAIQENLDQALGAVKRLEAENTLLKWTGGIALSALAIFAGYEGGHALKWW